MRCLKWCIAAGLILAITGMAGAASIRDRAEYRPSSDLLLGSYVAGKGYQMPDEFQLNLEYQAGSWDRARRVVAKIEWHFGELFPRYYFIVTNSRLAASKVVKVYKGERMLNTGSRKAKIPCAGTRRAATGSERTKPG